MSGASTTRFTHPGTTAFAHVVRGLFVLSALPAFTALPAFSAVPDDTAPPSLPGIGAEVPTPGSPSGQPPAFSPISAEAWDFGESKWQAEDGSVHLSGHGFSVAAVPAGLELETRATVRPVRCRSQASSAMGLAAYGSPGEFWRLALVKTSDRHGSIHRFELRAMSGGTWGRERQGARLLEIRDCGAWKYGRDYEFSLRCGPDRTVGQIADAETGEVLFRAVYGPAPGPAGEALFGECGRFGLRPALCVDGRFRGFASGLAARTEGEPAQSAEEAAAGLPVPAEAGKEAGLGRYAVECCEKAWAAILAANPAGENGRSPLAAGSAAWEDAGKLDAAADPGCAAAEEPRLCSLPAGPPAGSGPAPSGVAPLFARSSLGEPRPGDGGFFRRVDRQTLARVRAAPGGHEHGENGAGSGRGPELRGSGAPAGAGAAEENHAPPPAEVAAAPPRAA